MKKILLPLAITSIFNFSAFAQKASDVIENGIKIKSNNQVFIKFDGTDILYQANVTPNELSFKKIEDSTMLLPVDASVVFYIRPLNPLNYEYKSENKIIIDPIDEAAATALNSIIGVVQNMSIETTTLKEVTTKKVNNTIQSKIDTSKKCDFEQKIRAFNSLANRLMNNQKEKIAEIFKALKNLNFVTENKTIEDIGKAKVSLSNIQTYFIETESAIERFKESIKLISCAEEPYEFIVKRVFDLAAKDLEANYFEQRKRLKNLEKAYDVVKKAQEEASTLNWLMKLYEVPATKGKISIFTININETGYKLNDDDNEIIASDSKEKAIKQLRIRRFQRFVPEVSVGIAYTALSFPKYSTNTDSAGKHIVAIGGEESINKLNFSTMINYNYFMPNSALNPFWQIGIGVNTGFPTLLTGFGLRVNEGARRLALAVGIATTWIKTLDKLKEDEWVSGPAEVEKDLKYKFNKKPKMYFGIQYNF